MVHNYSDEESEPEIRSNHVYAKQEIGVPVEIRMKTGMNLPCPLDAEETIMGSRCKTPPRRRKMKGLCDLGEPSTH